MIPDEQTINKQLPVNPRINTDIHYNIKTKTDAQIYDST